MGRHPGDQFRALRQAQGKLRNADRLELSNRGGIWDGHLWYVNISIVSGQKQEGSKKDFTEGQRGRMGEGEWVAGGRTPARWGR
jgi:hypothetical protein